MSLVRILLAAASPLPIESYVKIFAAFGRSLYFCFIVAISFVHSLPTPVHFSCVKNDS
jgi:hypothetical protein